MWKFRCWEEYTDSGTVSAVWPGSKSHYAQFWSHLYMHRNDYTVLNVSSIEVCTCMIMVMTYMMLCMWLHIACIVIIACYIYSSSE